jgi:hypothetical protein
MDVSGFERMKWQQQDNVFFFTRKVISGKLFLRGFETFLTRKVQGNARLSYARADKGLLRMLLRATF